MDRKVIKDTPITDVDKIVQLLMDNKKRYCVVCGEKQPLLIIQMKCEINENTDKYGSAYDGHWECPLGHVKQVYPLPLKRAFENTVTSKYYNWSKYLQIAEKGYPWRCPKCNRILAYKNNVKYTT